MVSRGCGREKVTDGTLFIIDEIHPYNCCSCSLFQLTYLRIFIRGTNSCCASRTCTLQLWLLTISSEIRLVFLAVSLTFLLSIQMLFTVSFLTRILKLNSQIISTGGVTLYTTYFQKPNDNGECVYFSIFLPLNLCNSCNKLDNFILSALLFPLCH